jgi:hypothetical protein
VVVSGKEWWIRTEHSNENPAKRYYEAYCDGKNIFSFTKFAVKEDTANPPINDSSLVVDTGNFPPYISGGINPVWVAFCSGYHLMEAKNGRIAAFWDWPRPTFFKTNYPIRATWEFLDGDALIPSRISYWNEGRILRAVIPPAAAQNLSTNAMAKGISAKTDFAAAPEPFDQGFTNAVYEVLESGKVGTTTIPLHFKLTLNAVQGSDDGGYALRTSWVFEGKVSESSAVVTKPLFVLAPTNKTLVTDYRIRRDYPNIKEARYMATNGAVMTEKELVAIPAVKVQVEHLNQTRGVLLVIVCTLVILFASASVFWWKKTR